MRSVIVTGPGTTDVVDIPVPAIGPRDLLIRMRACGICGSDALYISYGGIPPRQGATPLGHEPAGEVVEVGAQVDGIAVGDHVVVNPIAAGQTGNGGPFGGLSDFLKIENAELGRNLAVVPNHVPFDIAAINEPMAVSRHAVNRTRARPGDSVVIFGAGPIGLGAAIAYKLKGAGSVVVADVIPERLATALAVGADAVINCAEDDVAGRLRELHGTASNALGEPRVGTDIYLDAAGAPVVIQTALTAAKQGATLGIVAMHKQPVSIDFGALISTELNIVTSMGYPTEIFEVTGDIAANVDRYSSIVSDRFAFDDVQTALLAASTPGTRGKVVVTFD
ncbi:MAG: zinc-dependent alcohol dehydrogenase [Acidimicrobiales bacterium]